MAGWTSTQLKLTKARCDNFLSMACLHFFNCVMFSTDSAETSMAAMHTSEK